MRILIAEDDFASRKYLHKLLSNYGECDMVANGLEAIDAYRLSVADGNPYELICLDIMMPKVDGVRALQAIRDLEKQEAGAQGCRSKIIMTTVLVESDFMQKAFEYGCDAYASKPIDMQKLIEIIRKLGFIT